MTAHWERDVRSLLRPSESLLLILDGSSLRHDRLGRRSPRPEAPPSTFLDDTSLASLGPSEGSRVILAVVGHDGLAMGESGRLILDTFTFCHFVLNFL
jgi:hypothetical protein